MMDIAKIKHSYEYKEAVHIFVAYYLIITAFFLASFFPEYRVWGFNWWAYFPLYMKITLLLTGIIILPIILFLSGKLQQNDSRTKNDSRSYIILVFCIIVFWGFAFILFRGKTHFLGDGYQLLSQLINQAPFVKVWDKGISKITKTIFLLLTGQPNSRALLTYQTISIVSGIMLLIEVSLFSFLLFKRNLQRLIFLLGTASSGYMLLFFGYVENYAPLILFFMLFTLVGLVIIKRRISRYWILLPFIMALFIHLFAITLMPGILYLLLKDTSLGKLVNSISIKTKYLFLMILFIMSGTLYYYLYNNYYFFTFALLPLIPDRFTVENDWLFSFKHIIDICNLLVLLLPGLLILVTMLFLSSKKKWWNQAEYRFLLVLIASSLGAVYVFNPGIGMPRNWDLFSITGVPLVICCYYFAIDNVQTTNRLLIRTVPLILLGFLSLGPRVATQYKPVLSISHFKNYMKLDRIRNRNAHKLLIDYYLRAGDTTAAKREKAKEFTYYPEKRYKNEALKLIKEEKYSEAMIYAKRVIDINPLYYDAYENMAVCLMHQGHIDSALSLLDIANGLNPNSSEILNDIGSAYFLKNDFKSAEKYFLKTLSIDSTQDNALQALVSIYLKQNDYGRSFYYVSKLYNLNAMPYVYFQKVADLYLKRRAYKLAVNTFKYAVNLGLDSLYIKQLQERFPQLK